MVRSCSTRTPDQLMVMAVELGDTFRGSTPQPLFPDPYLRDPTVADAPIYDVMPDGRGFVMVSTDQTEVNERSAVVLVNNFFEELRRVVPDN